ncbi:MAG: hypothetical protein WC989_00060 [Micavibrio sp.]
MLGWIVRGMLVLGGIAASWFVSRDAHIFPIASFVAGLLLFTLAVALAAYGPEIIRRLRKRLKKGGRDS